VTLLTLCVDACAAIAARYGETRWYGAAINEFSIMALDRGLYVTWYQLKVEPLWV
jgi:hypothetical protein